MIEWIKASDRLPPIGVPVLVRHRYRLDEYAPYAIGVRLHVTDDEDSPVYWTWTGVKLNERLAGAKYMKEELGDE